MAASTLDIQERDVDDLELVRITSRHPHLLGLLTLKTVLDVHDDEAAALRRFTWPR